MDIYKDKEKNMSTLLQLKSVGLQYYILTIQAGMMFFIAKLQEGHTRYSAL